MATDVLSDAEMAVEGSRGGRARDATIFNKRRILRQKGERKEEEKTETEEHKHNGALRRVVPVRSLSFRSHG